KGFFSFGPKARTKIENSSAACIASREKGTGHGPKRQKPAWVRHYLRPGLLANVRAGPLCPTTTIQGADLHRVAGKMSARLCRRLIHRLSVGDGRLPVLALIDLRKLCIGQPLPH